MAEFSKLFLDIWKHVETRNCLLFNSYPRHHQLFKFQSTGDLSKTSRTTQNTHIYAYIYIYTDTQQCIHSGIAIQWPVFEMPSCLKKKTHAVNHPSVYIYIFLINPPSCISSIQKNTVPIVFDRRTNRTWEGDFPYHISSIPILSLTEIEPC